MYARPRNKRRVYGHAGVQRNLVLRFHRTFGVLWKKVNRLKPRALHRWGYRMWLHRYHVRITGWHGRTWFSSNRFLSRTWPPRS